MMAGTRNTPQNNMKHLLQNVLLCPDGSNTEQALKRSGCYDSDIFYTWQLIDLDDLQVADPRNSTQLRPLIKGQVVLLRTALAYLHWRTERDGDLPDTWNDTNMSRKDYIRFIRSSEFARLTGPDGKLHLPASHSALSQLANSPDEKAAFKKSIKKNSDSFPVLNKDDNWNEFKMQVEAEARAQDMSEVFDTTFTTASLSKDQQDLFRLKQDFMFSVFTRILQTNDGKTAVRAHKDKQDAQKIWQDVVYAYENSTRAKIRANDLLRYITHARIGDGSWTGTTLSFLLHMNEVYRQYNELADTASSMNDAVFMSLLQSAVEPLDDLRQVKSTYEILVASGTVTNLGYEEYFALLKSAAQSYDSKVQSGATLPARRVYASLAEDSGPPDAEPAELLDVDVDIDTTVDQILVNQAKQDRATMESARADPDIWSKMTGAERKAWAAISPDIRAMINAR